MGHRRARNLQSKISNARKSGDTKTADKYQKKVNKIERKEKNFGGASERVKNMSAGAAIGKTALLGTYGTVKYEQSRAEGKSRAQSVLSKEKIWIVY